MHTPSKSIRTPEKKLTESKTEELSMPHVNIIHDLPDPSIKFEKESASVKLNPFLLCVIYQKGLQWKDIIKLDECPKYLFRENKHPIDIR